MEYENTTDLSIDERIKALENSLAKMEKRFENYLKDEEDHYFEFSLLRKEFGTFENNFHFVMSSKRTWFGKLVMWLMFKGEINDDDTEQ